MQIDNVQSLNISPASGVQPAAASQVASKTLAPSPQKEFLALSQEAERLAQQNQTSATDSVKVSASTGQSSAQGSLTEQQAIALYRKIASLL
ncbi:MULTISPECIES: hypothetical protein [unclassified Motilimonas]|uniref:hypothetical protein n=1 Tax=Motilimonas TaxID=1914248 RepID=UPI001E4F6684|nr:MULTISPECIES: hypothetical protein [unclassified Motilimonas]MCE0557223.1 hypothetical protein [Motilimonas sp. E26]MDO6526177.1 hypothetical protein [Motilimonas sp. 1_MG-2023]